MTNAIDNMDDVGKRVDESVIKHETLNEAFVYAQMEFEPIVHNCVVDFTPQGKRRVNYTYADLAQTQKALYPALNKHGLAIGYDVDDREGHVSLKIIMSHAFSDIIRECHLRMKEMEETKEQAKELTYLKRYLLGLITGTASEEDTLDQEQDDAQGGDEQSRGDNTPPKTEKATEGQAGASQRDESTGRQLGCSIAVRKLAASIGIADVKIEEGVETSKVFDAEKWKSLLAKYNNYNQAAIFMADELTKDFDEIIAFSQFKAGGWKALYADIKVIKDGGKVDVLWAEFTNFQKKDNGNNVDEDADDLKAAKATYSSLIDGREGWKTSKDRIAQEKKLSDKLYPVWGLIEHVDAIRTLEDEDELAKGE